METQIIEGCRLSPQQRQVWSERTTHPVAWTQAVVRLRGALQVDRLRHALRAQVELHEVLRTSFHLMADMIFPIQVTKEDGGYVWEEESWQGASAPDVAGRIERGLGEARSRLFALDRGPLLHVSLHQEAEQSSLLLVSCPALCLDSRGLVDLVRAVADDYGKQLRATTEEPLDPVQYLDYAEWQNESLDTQSQIPEAVRAVDFWKALDLEEISPPRLADETDGRAEPEQKSDELCVYAFSSELAGELRGVAHRLGVEVGAVLFAAWQTLLARRQCAASFLVGYTSDGRTIDDLLGCLGAIDYVLPYRVSFDERLSFAQLARDTSSQLANYSAFQSFFPLIGNAYLKTPSVGFAFQEVGSFQAAGCRFEVERVFCVTDRVRLQLSCLLGEDQLAVALVYDAVTLTTAHVKLLAEGYQMLLQNVVRSSDEAVGQLDVIGEQESQQLLYGWNDTAAEIPAKLCLHELFTLQASRTPEATAVISGDESLSYAGLEREASHLAQYLQSEGLRVEEPVGLYMSRQTAQIVGVLGILKAGGAFVPINPTDPVERVLRILDDCRARFVITESGLAEAVKGAGRVLLCVDDGVSPEGTVGWGTLSGQQRAEAPGIEIKPHNLAYIIYTSGSTGAPKGVMIEHRSVVNLHTALHQSIYQHQQSLSERRWRVSLNAPLSFDSSIKQLALLLDGHTLCIVSDEARLDPTAFIKFQQQHQLDVLDCTPSQLKLLLAAGLWRRGETMPQVVLVGGEAISAPLWQELAQIETTAFYNVYGPTECAVDTTVGRVSGASAAHIGRPIANARVYLLSPEKRVVPIGGVGEIHIAGAGLARAYVGDPDLTAARFIEWESAHGGELLRERLYATGDLGRFASDGRLIFVGRKDHQVKVRGYRIELEEIECALESHPLVRRALALVHEDNSQQSIIAYVVGEKSNGDDQAGEDLSAETLRAYLAQKVPDYMLPAAYVLLDALPLMPSGKVDRRALAELSAQHVRARKPYAPPESDLEKILIDTWEDLLHVEKVGVHDNFFDLGGHSLLMVQAHSRLQETFEREFSVIELFRYPTLRAMAEYLGKAESAAPSLQAVLDRAARQRAAIQQQYRQQAAEKS
ncbi:MAG: amino acid adenylation domain-containing protein [Pyrinomonadaceae bacterium]